MLTVRQIERLWNARSFGRLATELLQGRAEASTRTLLDCSHRVPCAALALVRLDEYAQPHHPLARTLLDTLLAAQDADGGWGDAATTALVLRALATSKGQGPALDRGLAFLAMLRHDSGTWPRIPLRRSDADDLTTTLVLLHLAHVPYHLAKGHGLVRAPVTVTLARTASSDPARVAGTPRPGTPGPAASEASKGRGPSPARTFPASDSNSALSPVARHLLRLTPPQANLPQSGPLHPRAVA